MLQLHLTQLLFFLPLLILVAALVPKKWKSAVLTLGGLTACALTDWRVLLYALLSVFLGWFAVRSCPRTLTGPYAGKARAWIGISFLLQVICVCVSGGALLVLLSAIQAMICIVDRANGMLKIPSLPQYLCYVCEYPRWFGFSPTDFKTYRTSRENRQAFSIERFASGLGRIVTGVFQIVILSLPIHRFHLMILEPQATMSLSFADSWLCAIASYCCLYFMLHGWLDIGQGILLVLGYDQPDGYGSATIATSLREYLGAVWKPMRAAVGDIVGIPTDSAKMPIAKWSVGVFASMLAMGLVFSEHLLHGVIWGVIAAFVLLFERMLPESFLMKLPKIVKIFCVNLIAILFCYSLFQNGSGGQLSGLFLRFGKGSFALSSAALYALSWYWVELLLCIISLFPLRRFYLSMLRKHPLFEKINVVLAPVGQLAMLVLSIMYLVAAGIY